MAYKKNQLGCDEVVLPRTVFKQYGTAQKYIESLCAEILSSNKQLAETQAQLKEAREALEEISHGDDTAPETMRRIAKEVLSRSADYSVFDAAIETYRLDADRLISCRPSVKFHLNHLERVLLRKDLANKNLFEDEARSTQELLEAIDAAIAKKG